MSSAPNGEGSEPPTNLTDNVTRRQAWNRPVNVAVETAPVMGAVLWPSLSETANAPQRPPRTAPEGSSSLNHQASSSRNPATNSIRPTSTQNGTHPGRHKSTRNHGRSYVGNGDRSQPPSSQGPASDVSSNNGSYNNGSSQPEAGQNNGPRSQFHSGGNHPQHRDSNRRGSGGPNTRGDGPHGRRRNVDRGDRDANTHPSYNARNGLLQPTVFPGTLPSYLPRPALSVPPYAPPPPPFVPMQFMAPVIHPIAGQRVFYGPPINGPLPLRPPPLQVPFGPQIIISNLMKQIDYYFSDDNLVRDVHLRRNMDEQGWVSVTLIAEFQRVKDITAQAKNFLDENDNDPLQFILNVMQNSPFVEVQGDKLRRRNGWEKYILPNIVESSSSAVENLANGELATRLENTMLEEKSLLSDSKLDVEAKAAEDQVGQ
uniref:HTH La-type RNA-binding domain-containing protein n=1 Tax=Kalanchoe fedtschenkoi TaxID=63787 RepID=A0A7N1A2A6_KALFE